MWIGAGESEVVVQVTVQPDGRPADVLVVSGRGPAVDAEVVRVVSAARFQNAVGEAWESRLRVPVCARRAA